MNSSGTPMQAEGFEGQPWGWRYESKAELDATKAAGGMDEAAYKEVVNRLGNAKPRSVTAEKARAHAKALGCPK